MGISVMEQYTTLEYAEVLKVYIKNIYIIFIIILYNWKKDIR